MPELFKIRWNLDLFSRPWILHGTRFKVCDGVNDSSHRSAFVKFNNDTTCLFSLRHCHPVRIIHCTKEFRTEQGSRTLSRITGINVSFFRFRRRLFLFFFFYFSSSSFSLSKFIKFPPPLHPSPRIFSPTFMRLISL